MVFSLAILLVSISEQVLPFHLLTHILISLMSSSEIFTVNLILQID
ncbi:hypothetical protein Lalb_Chr04g0262081 [Lupinus albus]|uniref:Uncharacterized protein n=1 Tax=Lupinus albus TaxID=3870 RepID=A0A6A4QQF8_LUPAL|nr:hypothetical protein Lalb_Chr04g0262081 [Lupinus albus]